MPGFAQFWVRHRPYGELGGLSLAAARGLLGVQEERFAGFVAVRDDLPIPDYLALPAVRRLWRLVGEIGREESVCTGCVAEAPSPARAPLPPERPSSPLLGILREAQMVLPGHAAGEYALAPVARILRSTGAVGLFYRALLVQLLQRSATPAVPGTALFLLYQLHHSGSHGLSPLDLVHRVEALARLLPRQDEHAERLLCGPGPSHGFRDAGTVADSIRDALLVRLGRITALIEPVPWQDDIWRISPFGRRVLRWSV